MKCKITATESYLLILSLDELKYGDWGTDEEYVAQKSNKIDNFFDKHYPYKVIYHLPLNGAKPLFGVALLPEIEDNYNKVQRNADAYGSCTKGSVEFKLGASKGFEDGYNKAREKYKLTGGDVIKIVEKSRETGLTAEFLMLSLHQSYYPNYFEFETELVPDEDNYGTGEVFHSNKKEAIKTITNHLGQVVAVGTYKFK